MVTASNHLSNLFQEKSGISRGLSALLLNNQRIERCFGVPLVASLSKPIRKLFDQKSGHHLNFVKTFDDRLEIYSDEKDYVSLLPLNDAKIWIEVLKHAATQFYKLRLSPV